MPPPRPLLMTAGPYVLRRRSRSLIEILGAVTAMGGRDLVALVDGAEVEANAAGLKEMPALFHDGWALADELYVPSLILPAAAVSRLITFHATLLRCHP